MPYNPEWLMKKDEEEEEKQIEAVGQTQIATQPQTGQTGQTGYNPDWLTGKATTQLQQPDLTKPPETPELEQPETGYKTEWLTGKKETELTPEAQQAQMFTQIGQEGYVSQEIDPEEREFKGFVWKLLGDYLQRGNFASANVADALLKGDGNLLGAAWRGLTGEEKRTYSDVLRGFGAHNTVAEVAGIVLDFALDPVTWIPFGAWLKAGTKGLKTSKVGQKVAKSKVGTTLTNVANNFYKLFDPAEGAPKELYKLKKFFHDTARYEEGKFLNKVEKWTKGIPKEQRELMTKIKEGKAILMKLSKKEKDTYLKLTNELQDIGKEAVRMGMMTKESFDKWSKTYTRFWIDGKSTLIDVSGTYGKAGALKERFFDSITDYNDFFIKMKDDIVKATTKEQAVNIATRPGPKGYKLFSKDAADAMSLSQLKSAISKKPLAEMDYGRLAAIRGIEHIREKYRVKFVKTAVDQFGTPLRRAAKLKALPEGTSVYIPRSLLSEKVFTGTDDVAQYISKIIDNPATKEELINIPVEIAQKLDDKLAKLGSEIPAKYLVPDDVAHYLNKAYVGLEVGGREVEEVVKAMYDPVLNMWKGMVTVMRPSFHIRNMTSNVWQAWMGGIPAQNLTTRHIQSIKMARKLNSTIKTKNLGELSYKTIRELAEKYGVVGKGWAGADIPHGVLMRMEEIFKGKTLGQKIDPMTFGRQAGRYIEDLSRGATFIDELVKSSQKSLGRAAMDAAERAAKYHFDYGEISAFEQKFMKRIVPFYTWMRKNIPTQFRELFEQPDKYSKLGKIHRGLSAIAKETKDESKFTPDWMQEMGYLKSPWKSEAGNPYYYYIDLPVKDLDSLFSVRDMVSGLAPMLKAPIELIWGVETFPEVGRKMTQPGYEYTYAPGWTVFLPESVQKSIGVTKWYDKYTGKQVLKMPKKSLYVIETIMPPLREVHTLMPQKVELLEDRALTRALGYPTGMQFRSVDVTRERTSLMAEANRLRREIIAHYKETGIMDISRKERLDEILLKFKK